MKSAVAMLAMLAAACEGAAGGDGSGGQAQEAHATTTARRSAIEPPAICGNGADGAAPDADVVRALGRPAEETRFPLSENLTEFRIKLLNRFELPRDSGVEILERSWAEGPCRLTIWSAKRGDAWGPVEWLRWREGDEF